MSVAFACDLAAPASVLPHVWEHTVGSDHATAALRADWQAHLERAHEELGFRHVRFQGILDDDVGTLLCEQGKLAYAFFNSDQIFDFLIGIGMKPFVELAFMPSTLSSGSTTVFKYRGNVTSPKDDAQWSTLIGKLGGHRVDHYGLDEVGQWYFEIWNEPTVACEPVTGRSSKRRRCPAVGRSCTALRPSASASCRSSAATICRAHKRTGTRKSCSSTRSINARRPGTARTATAFIQARTT